MAGELDQAGSKDDEEEEGHTERCGNGEDDPLSHGRWALLLMLLFV